MYVINLIANNNDDDDDDDDDTTPRIYNMELHHKDIYKNITKLHFVSYKKHI
jgi:hypothetical protein